MGNTETSEWKEGLRILKTKEGSPSESAGISL